MHKISPQFSMPLGSDNFAPLGASPARFQLLRSGHMNRLVFAAVVGYLLVLFGSVALAAEHAVGAHRLVVEPKDNNFFISRTQGISMSVSPTRPWWCLWLCTIGTTNAEVLNGRASLSGLQANLADNTCFNCGKLDVMGPTHWGVNVPQPYSRADYSATIRIDGASFDISGVILY